jgi:hypothetical protein
MLAQWILSARRPPARVEGMHHVAEATRRQPRRGFHCWSLAAGALRTSSISFSDPLVASPENEPALMLLKAALLASLDW